MKVSIMKNLVFPFGFTLLVVSIFVQTFIVGYRMGQKHIVETYEQDRNLEATMLSVLIKEFDQELKNNKNKAIMHRAVAAILSVRQENTFREDDVHYLLWELRQCILTEADPHEKAKMQEIYDREQKWLEDRRKARKKKNNNLKKGGGEDDNK